MTLRNKRVNVLFYSYFNALELIRLSDKLLVVCIILLTVQTSLAQTPRSLILNPYRGVNWQSFHQYKANLHTHTTYSDGVFHPHEAVDFYHNADYHILSITDHNLITWPWTDFSLLDTNYLDRDAQLLGMLAVMGNELSASHHTGSYIHSVPGDGAIFTAALDSMILLDGLGILFHPGSYWKIDSLYAPNDQYSPEWYVDLLNTYPVLSGIEVYNQGNRHPHDAILWDELLGRMMPARPVWGYSNDDMHVASQLFRNYNFMLMPALDINEFKNCMRQGAMFFVWEPAGDGTPLVPVIDSIRVDLTTRSVMIHGQNHTAIEWVSGINGTGSDRTSKIVGTGNTFSYNDFYEPYVRAVLINNVGRTYTQPFGFDTIPPAKTDTLFGVDEICIGTDTLTFFVDEDELAEFFHWQLPTGATIISGSNTSIITADFSNVTHSGFIALWKTNASGTSDTLFHPIVVHQIPDKPVVILQNNVLVSSAKMGNQWHDQYGEINGATDQTFTPSSNGIYSVIVTLNGCHSPPSDTVLVNTGIEKTTPPAWIIYPNPADRTILLSGANNPYRRYALSIIHLDGRMLLRKEIHTDISGMAEIDVSSIPEGLHLLRITNENSSLVQKVLILR